MPCMGPDLNQARKKGEAVYHQFREMLEKQHGINPQGIFFRERDKKEIEAHWAAIRNGVEELFVQQACEDW